MAEGNVQDISVHDKDVPALAATREAQDMSTLDRKVVPMPQFVDPHKPETNSGSVNLSLDAHPVEHSADYAAEVAGDSTATPMDVGAGGDAGGAKSEDEWTVEDYKDALRAADLPVSGNKDELEARWNEHKANSGSDNES